MPFSIKNKCALEKGKKEEGTQIQDFLLLVIRFNWFPLEFLLEIPHVIMYSEGYGKLKSNIG